jgi:hypothetical protein
MPAQMYSYTVYDGQHLKRVGCVLQWLSKGVPRVPLGVPRNFGCYIIAGKKTVYNSVENKFYLHERGKQ